MKIRLIGATAAITALVLAGCASTSPGYSQGGGGYGSGYGAPSSSCYDCGTVTRIDTRSRGGTAPNATGAVLGGIVGAVAAREIADRNTDSEGRKNTATAAGAVGGAVAGNAIQNRVQSQAVYDVHIRMDDGRMNVVTQNDLGGIREGSYVRVAEGRAWIR
jgi:outer membrane lipoprotein SlyB